MNKTNIKYFSAILKFNNTSRIIVAYLLTKMSDLSKIKQFAPTETILLLKFIKSYIEYYNSYLFTRNQFRGNQFQSLGAAIW